jgi:hypothetical protein
MAPPMGSAFLGLLAALPIVVWTMAGLVAPDAGTSCGSDRAAPICRQRVAPAIGTFPIVAQALEPAARQSPRPKRTPKPKPTPKPRATSQPVSQSTPKPYSQPTAAPVVAPPPRATTKATTAASVVPGARATASGGGEGTAGVDPDDPGGGAGIIIALGAAVSGGVLMAVAILRRRSEGLEGQAEEAVPGTITAETPSAPPIVSPAPSSEPAEAHLPRWLRPSVRASRSEAARGTSPSRGRDPLTFATPVDEEAERLLVRYDVVPLLDRPDEALGLRQDELDWGDEVEILEREGTWVQVRTPTGRTGWISAMTLTSADTLTDESETEERTAEIDGGIDRDDQPTLETLLAIAAERRTPIEARSPVAPDEPRDLAAGSGIQRLRRRKAKRLRSSPTQRP